MVRVISSAVFVGLMVVTIIPSHRDRPRNIDICNSSTYMAKKVKRDELLLNWKSLTLRYFIRTSLHYLLKYMASS